MEACQNMGEVRMNAADFRTRFTELCELAQLNERETVVATLRFFPGYSCTLRQIADVIHRGPERVRQIEAKALRKMRPAACTLYGIRLKRTAIVREAQAAAPPLPFLDVLAEATFHKPFNECWEQDRAAIVAFAKRDYFVQAAIKRGNPTPFYQQGVDRAAEVGLLDFLKVPRAEAL